MRMILKEQNVLFSFVLIREGKLDAIVMVKGEIIIEIDVKQNCIKILMKMSLPSFINLSIFKIYNNIVKINAKFI